MAEELKKPTPSRKPIRAKHKLDKTTKKESSNRQPCGPLGGSDNYMELSPTRRERNDGPNNTQSTDINHYQSLVKSEDLNRDSINEPVYNNVDT